jgi:hypothetical protein
MPSKQACTENKEITKKKNVFFGIILFCPLNP